MKGLFFGALLFISSAVMAMEQRGNTGNTIVMEEDAGFTIAEESESGSSAYGSSSSSAEWQYFVIPQGVADKVDSHDDSHEYEKRLVRDELKQQIGEYREEYKKTWKSHLCKKVSASFGIGMAIGAAICVGITGVQAYLAALYCP